MNNKTARFTEIISLAVGSDGGAVGDALAHDTGAGLREWFHELIRHDASAAPILEHSVLVPFLDDPLRHLQLVVEPRVRRPHRGVIAPRRGLHPSEVLLVGGVAGQHLQHRHHHRCLHLRREAFPERLVRVVEEFLQGGVVHGLLHRHLGTRDRGAVREVPPKVILPEVDRRVVRRRDPDYCGERVREGLRRVQLRPPRRLLLVAVSLGAHLRPERLQLLVLCDAVVVRVVPETYA